MELKYNFILLLIFVGGGLNGLKIGISRTTTPVAPVASDEPITISTTASTKRDSTTEATVVTTLSPESKPDINSSSSSTFPSTTTPPTATTPKIVVNSTTDDESNNETLTLPVMVSRKVIPHYFCQCDITISSCDTNCCCDIDCPAIAVKYFDCSSEKNRNTQPDYLPGYGLPPCSVSSSWFCVVNVDHNFIQTSDWTFDNAKQLDYKRWPESFSVLNAVHRSSESYQLNDHLLFFNEVTEELSSINLITSVFGKDCNFRETIRFLQDQKSKCHNVNKELLESCYLQNVSNWKVLSDLRFSSEIMSEYCTEITDFCVPLTLQLCRRGDSSLNCTMVNEMVPSNNFTIEKLSFEFIHNFTHIRAAEITIVGLFNLTEGEGNPIDIGVHFMQERKDEIFTFKASGNVGYESGSPIIVSQLTTLNITDGQEVTRIEFFNTLPENSSSYLITTPSSNLNDESCSTKTVPINFNENSITQCYLKLGYNIETKANLTDSCRQFQAQIMSTVFKNDTLNSLFVSQFGNPRNNTKFWTKVQLKSPFDLAKVSGELQEENFLCRNMILEIEIKFFYARITDDVSRAKHQSVIQGVTVNLGPQLDLQFNVNETFEVPLTMKVLFLDLTSTSAGDRCRPGINLMVVIGVVLSAW